MVPFRVMSKEVLVLVSVVFCNMYLLGLRKIQATPRKQALGFFFFNLTSTPVLLFGSTQPRPPLAGMSKDVLVWWWPVRVVFCNMYLLGLKKFKPLPQNKVWGFFSKFPTSIPILLFGSTPPWAGIASCSIYRKIWILQKLWPNLFDLYFWIPSGFVYLLEFRQSQQEYCKKQGRVKWAICSIKDHQQFHTF